MQKIFWLVGEKSGDLHASYVLEKLNNLGEFTHYGVGGERMQKQGLQSLFEFSRFNVMGFVEVIKHLHFFLSVEKEIKQILETNRPDLLVLVDYPGLNLRIAKIAKDMGIKVLYYICPQFWAWKHKRVFKIKEYTDFVCCINPFESAMLDEYDIPNQYVGHPVAEEISAQLTKSAFAQKFALDESKEWIGMFPGSRRTEFIRHFEIFNQVALHNPQRLYLLSISNKAFLGLIEPDKITKNIVLIENYNYDIMKHSDFVVAKSGTTTLETTLFATPFIIVYKVNPITVAIAKRIAKVKYIGLPNLIVNEEIIPELIQNDVNPSRILSEIESVLQDEKRRTILIKKLSSINSMLGDKSASQNTSLQIIKLLNNE